MADDLLDRLTKALMDAMVCKCDHRPGRPGCRNHTKVVLYGVIDCDWPCPVAVRAADALLPFVRDEVADELHSVVAERDSARDLAARLEAQIARVEALAEDWRYKDEFGWGPWQEGYGPDLEGAVLDDAAARLRAALTEFDDR